MESQATSTFSVDSGVAYGSPSGNIINSYYYSPPLAVGQLDVFVPTNGQNSAQYPANKGFPVRIISVDDTPTNNTNPEAPVTATAGNKAFGFAANQGIQYGNNESYYAPTASRPTTPPATAGSTPAVVPGGPVRFNMTDGVNAGLTNASQAPSGLGSRAVEAATDNTYYQLFADQNLPTPPSGPPPVPTQLGAKTDTSIPVQFDTAGIAGTQPITYGIYIGTTNPPTGPLIAASVLSGTVVYAVPTGLVPSTQYYICSVADNGVGDPKVSAPLIISTTATPTNPAPAPGIPYVSPTIPPTSTTITIEFDAAGVVGTPSVTFASVLNPGIVPGAATLVSGTIYRSTYTGLSANINYVFQSSAVANVPSGIIYSGLSAPIQTAPPPPPAPTGTLTAPVQYRVPGDNADRLAVRFDVSAVVGATSYAIYYSPTTTIGVTPYPAQLAIPPSTYQAEVVGLYNTTDYYFWAVASNAGGSLTGPISAAIVTDLSDGTEPSAPPPIPTLQTSTETSLIFEVDGTGITGTPTPQFLMNLALPGGNPIQSKQAVPIFGTFSYDASFTGLTPGQGYQCQAVAFNGIPNNQASAYTATILPGTPPSGTLTIPTFVSATSTTITVAFDASDVTGTLPISIICRDNGSPTVQSQNATLISGSTYNATFVGYAPSSDHTFQSIIASPYPPEVESDFSAPFSTTA